MSDQSPPIREPEISRLPKDAVERLLADHFGWRPYALMASDRSDLRGKIRDGYDYDINEPTRSDLSETADAILNLAPVGAQARSGEALSALIAWHTRERHAWMNVRASNEPGYTDHMAKFHDDAIATLRGINA